MRIAGSLRVRRYRSFAAVFLGLVTMVFGGSASAGEVRVAVAANFSAVLSDIAERFTDETGHLVRISTGSTGLLFTQISQGAPFDIFMAADQERPDRLLEEGYAVADSGFVYAVGRLVLYSAEPGLVEDVFSLQKPQIDRIAIANPRTAPYGAAAYRLLEASGLLESFDGRIVQGANIAQTFQFVATQSVDAGFVALSQVVGRDGGSRWIVPADMHDSLAQKAVLLITGKENPASVAFMAYLRTPEIQQLIQSWGYDVPTGS